MAIPDEQLISSAAGGDRTAFEELYRRYVPLVYGFLCRYTGSRTEADDLTQDVFVQAWRKLPAFRSESALGTWLVSIAISTVRSNVRSSSRRRRRDDVWHRTHTVRTGKALSPEEQIDLDRAIRTLPARARMVVVLRHVHGFRHAEIASMLGITEGASKAHLWRALRLLRRRLEE